MQKIELFVIGGMVAVALGVTAAFSTGPGGFTMTAEEARIAAHQGPRLIVVESYGCGWCKRLRKDLAPEYLSSTYHTEVAPLVYADINSSAVRKLTLDAPINSTPTLLMVDREGNELGRLTGYPGSISRMMRFVGKYASS